MQKKLLALLALAALGLAGCGGAGRGDADPLGGPVALVEEGAEAIRQGVGKMGDVVTAGAVSRATASRRRENLLREHREMSAHLERLKRFLGERRVRLSEEEERLLERTRQDLAAAARALREADAPPRPEITRRLDRARGAFNRFAERRGAPPYEGHIAVQ